ncbi:MAG TPA: tRNA lysidine(34) synthetase TilS [Pyrinomonadaceae bacterium]|nr:tRNA lysidine(34) synthetase TilS [Pyrinomonadaceae bacterium]
MGRRVDERENGRARLSRFARRLLSEWKKQGWPLSGEAALIAVSGGADSVALLLATDELLRACSLRLKVTVAHLDHGLRGASGEEDARWVETLARDLGYECVAGSVDARAEAQEGRDNLEQAARRARYEFLGATARACGARFVLTAHTLDDQAETVLLRLLRGSGAEGLGGIRPERRLDSAGDAPLLVRPLLGWARRADTESFCVARGVGFRIDEMNEDESFARVRVRRRLLPLLETFNPRAAEALARAADLLHEDARALGESAAKLLNEASDKAFVAAGAEKMAGDAGAEDERAWPLRADVLAAAPPAVRRRALRLWLARGRGDVRRIESAHVAGIERLLKGERGGRVAELPGGSRVERRRGRLVFRAAPG